VQPLTSNKSRLLLTVDRLPDSDDDPERRADALFVYRKITALTCVRCCGMCGSVRHATKPFWCLGMRLCRHCVQANLVSSLVLYERYWITFTQPVLTHASFVDAVCMNVFFFSTRLTPNQRIEFSCNRMDFPGGIRTVWFFWMPHLRNVLDMDRLERLGQEKHAAARILRSHARRMLVLRAMRFSAACRTVPTYAPEGVFTGKRDLRCIEHRLRKTELLDKSDMTFIQKMSCQLPGHLYARLSAAEDRVTPFLFN
jgi:hypothetical protein